MSILVRNINEALKYRDLTVADIERSAGIKKSALRNIIYGRSNKPSLDLINAVANELGYSVDQLSSENFSPEVEDDNSVGNIKIIKKTKLNFALLVNIVNYLNNEFSRNLKDLQFYQYNLALSEIYQYSFERNKPNLDKDFASWWLQRNLPSFISNE